MKRRHYIAVLLCAAAALTAGAGLLPGPFEVALMRLKDGDYIRARRTYEDRYRRGERDKAVVAALREIYLQHAELERAVLLMEGYVSEHPEDLAARRMLGDTYLAAQLPERYTANLARIARMAPSPEVLSELASWYEKQGSYERQADALERLAALSGITAEQAEETVLKLARLQAAGGNAKRAAGTLRTFARTRPADGTGPLPELLIRLMIDSGQAAEIPSEAAGWVKGKPETAARIAEVLLRQGQSGAALTLLAGFSKEFQSHPALLMQLVEAERAAGKTGQALTRLAGLRRGGKLPPQALPVLADLAIENREFDLAGEIIGQSAASLPAWVIASFLDASFAAGRRDLAEAVWRKVGAGSAPVRPLLAAEMALARGDKAEAARWAEEARKSDAEPRDRIAVASILLQLEKRDEARTALEGVPFGSLPEASQVQLAWLWVDAGQVDRGRREIAAGGAGPAWAILAAAAGDPALDAWVEKSEPGDRLLLDLYYLAARKSSPRLQWTLARKLAGRKSPEAEKVYRPALMAAAAAGLPVDAELEAYATPRLAARETPENEKEQLVFALLAAKADKAALPALEQWARTRRGQWFSAFLEASLRAGNREALLRFLESDLGRTDLSLTERQERLYALTEQGGPARSVAYTRQFAEQYGGQWDAAYEAALTALGRKQDLLNWWRKRAARPGLPDAEKRVLAFNLLDAGERALAEPLLMGLAAGADPNSADVRQLTSLWGWKAPKAGLDWMANRLRAASGGEKLRWLELLYEAGGRRQAIEAGRTWPSPKPEPYLRALQAERETIALAAAIQNDASASKDPEHLRRLARLALEESLREPASFAYERLCALKHNDIEGLGWLGRLAYADRRYASARMYLDLWAKAGGTEIEPMFVRAQAVEQEEGRAAAAEFYRRTAEAAAAAAVKPSAVRIAEAIALERTGQWEESRARFDAMLAADAANWPARAEYAALLIERLNWADASKVLSGSQPAGGDARKRLEVLRAQVDLGQGKLSAAADRYRRVLAEDPRDPALLTSLALAEAQSGRKRRADALFRQAIRESPAGGDAERLREEVLREERDRVRAEHLRRTVGSQWSEQVLRVSGQTAIAPGTRAGMVLEASLASVTAYRDSSGSIVSFDGLRRRGEMYVEHDLDGGTRWRGQFFMGNRPGGGLQASMPDGRGATTVSIELHRPYWEFMESLAQYGVRSRMQAERSLRLGRATAWLGGSANRYGVGGVSRAASTYGVSGGISYPFGGRRNPWVVQYGFDTERRTSVATRLLADGIAFRPLDFLSREVHAFGAGTSRQWGRHWRVEGSAGAAVDRLGGRGPYFTGRLGYDSPSGLTFEAWVDRRLNQVNTSSAAATQFGVSATWRFKAR